jgi:hypothetical protein
MTWTIPLVMSNLNNNPTNQYGLVGVVTLNPPSGSNPYTGTVVFTKPANAFANQQFNLKHIQYPCTNPTYQGELYFEIGPETNGTTTPIQLAQQFGSNGGYNPNGNNPPVNIQGEPPVFSFHAPWNGQSSVIVNGQARLPRRLLIPLGQGNSGWQQVQFNGNGTYTGTGGNLTIFSQNTTTGSSMLYLAAASGPNAGGNVVFQLNLTPVTGVVIILNMQSWAASPQISVFASTSPGGTETSIGNFYPAVSQYSTQAFFIPSTYLQTGNNWITVQNTGVANVFFQKATFAW